MGKKLPLSRYKHTIKTIPLSLIDQNEGQIPDVPRNPRFIRDEKFDALLRSIQEDPEMLYLRETIVYPIDGRYVAIGGNQRTAVLQYLDIDEIVCKVLDTATPAERIRAYISKDNYGYGENDQKILHDEWAEFEDEFEQWGMDDVFMDDIMEEEIEENVPSPKEKKDLSNELEIEYKIEVSCINEAEQEQLFNDLTGKGYSCRILTL